MMRINSIYFKRRDYLSKEGRREGVPVRSCCPEVRVSAWGPAYRPSRFHPGWRDWINGTSSVLCTSRRLRRRRKRSGLGCADLQAKAGTALWRGSAATTVVLLQKEQKDVGEPLCLTRCWDELASAVDADIISHVQLIKLFI